MTLSSFSIKNPVFAVMLAVAMIVFGYLGYQDMGVSRFPEVDFPVVSVVVNREAASPEVMDGDVTDIIEDALAAVEGVDYLMSQSLEGASIVTVYFRLSQNIDVAMQDVQNAVNSARRRLPIDIDPPVISKVNPNNLPVMWLTLSGPVPLTTISDFAEKDFKQHIAGIDDVGGIQFAGLQSRNIRIWLNAERLRAYNLTAEEVLESLRSQHAELPAGSIRSSLVEFNLRTMGEAYTLEELNQIVVRGDGSRFNSEMDAGESGRATARSSLQTVFLRDVAVIEDGLEDRRSLARFNRMPAVAVGVRKAIGGNLVSVCDNVKAELPKLNRMLPEGVELHVPVDYSLFIRESVEELRLTLFLGIILTAGVCFLFLGSLGTTINICLAIPTSLVGSFFVLNYGMKFIGVEPFTINLMTLLALSLSVGVVVDDAILVLENIYRHRQQGADRKKAAHFGAKEITFAAMAATFSIMAIFLPVAFMTGVIGKFFFQFGVTVGVAVFLSLISALTLTPMLCSLFLNLREKIPSRPMMFGWPLALVAGLFAAGTGVLLRLFSIFIPALTDWAWPIRWILNDWLPSIENMFQWWAIETSLEFGIIFLLVKFGNQIYWAIDRFILGPLLLRPTEWAIEKLTSAYARLLGWAIHHWAFTLLWGGALAVVMFAMLYFNVLGRELTPSEDQSRFVVHVVCPVGSSIAQVDGLLQECEQVLVGRPEIEGFLTTVATEQGQLINEADIFVDMVPHAARTVSQSECIREVRSALEGIGDIKVSIRDQSTEGFTPQSSEPIDFAITGPWAELPLVASSVMAQMEESGFVDDIDSDYRPGMAEVHVIPERDKLAQLGVPVRHLADNMSLLIGGQRVAKFTDQGRRYDVRVQLKVQQRDTPNDLDLLTIRAGDNRLVPLSDVAWRQTVATLPVVHRLNHQRKIEITANPAQGVSQGEAMDHCREIAQSSLPAGFEIMELGNAKALQETMNSLIFALILGIIIAYMILGVQFNSFVHPLAVLLALPFAGTGALVTLWLTGDTLNMMSMIGMILLMGLVKKNSIILVDYTNQRLHEMDDRNHQNVVQAVMTACPVRLRPILMTSIATIAGALPAALGLGPGAETRAPMARGIIGGIALSTLVTLIMVPVFYVLIERVRFKIRHLLPRQGG